MDAPIGKEIPYSAEAEMAVLGAVIVDGESLSTVMERLKEEDFYQKAHQVIYHALLELFNQAIQVDVVTLSNQLGNQLEAVGGVPYLAHLAGSVQTTANLRYYIDIVKNKSTLRKLIQSAGDISDLCFSGEDGDEALNFAEQRIFDIAEGRDTTEFAHIKDVVIDSVARLEELRKNGGKITGIPTGFTDLDHRLAGLQNSDLILIAARPGMGKTSFALNIAEYAATHAKVPVAIFSLEMSKEQLVNRMLWSEAMVESERMRIGDVRENDIQKLSQAIGILSAAPIYIDDTPGIKVSEIRAKCRKLKLKHGLGLIVIDYLQLMQSGLKTENRVQAVSEMTRSLKILAKELNVPVITLSQLSRAPEKRGNEAEKRRPMLSDLRESGSIEQDADIVLFLNRDYYGEDPEKQNEAECIIAKHRQGSIGTVELIWRGEFTRFMNKDRRVE